MRSEKKSNLMREAWLGPLSADAIAKHFGLPSAQSVRDFWKREKTAGRMDFAIGKDRPHFGVVAVNCDDEIEAENFAEAAKTSSENGLEALRAAYGDNAGAMEMPAEFLVGEMPTNPRNFDPDAHAMFAARILKKLPACISKTKVRV